MKIFKNRSKNIDYQNTSRVQLIEELEKSFSEFSSLKEAFTQINTQLQHSQKELEATANKLMACENQFSSIFDNMFNGLLIVEIYTDKSGNPYDHKFTHANKVSEKLTGLKAKDIIGKSSHELNLNWPQELLNQLYQVTKDGKPIEYERYNELAKKYFHTQVFSPAPNQLAFVFDDISERKKSEIELITAKEKAEENEMRFKAISEQAMEGIALANTDGDYVFVNPAFCKMTGYSEEELLKMNVFDIAILENEESAFQKLKENKESSTTITRRKLICKDKSTIYADINSKWIRINNEDFILGVIRDVTEQIESEKELITAKEQAEEGDRLKTAFLMNLSHEIRTPMNAILGFLDLLKEPDLDDSQKNEYIDIVNKSGERLLDTINDIIEISRIEAGETIVSEDLVNVDEMIEYYYESFKQETKLKGLKFDISLEVSENLSTIKTDRGKLESILANLIKNAIKFTEKGGIEIGNYQEDDNLVIYVKDSGRGIPYDRFDAIFERFVQADISLTRTHEGSGLGLAIVKAYLDAMGGKIWLKSEIGLGSTFHVSLPLQHCEKKPFIPGKSLPDDLTILIVEDDELSYQYYEILLAPYFKLIHERTGIDALKTFETNKDISLILMDIKMPGDVDGFEATRQIRKKNKEIPIIAQTAFAMEIDRQKAMEAGCSDFITKPVSREKLLSLVAKHCQSKN